MNWKTLVYGRRRMDVSLVLLPALVSILVSNTSVEGNGDYEFYRNI
jgi:hypothetical protein